MKTAILFLLLLCVYIYPQQSLFTNNSPTDVVKLDPKGQKFEFVPGVILVKLNDDAVVGLLKRNGFSVTGISSVDLILQKYKAASAEKLFPNAERPVQKQLLKLYNGKTIERPSLHNIYKLKIQNEQELFQAIDELKQDPNVVYAEPNYILSIVNSEPLSPPLNESEMLQWIKDNPNAIPKTNKGKNTNSPLIITPNDPLYSQQWGIPACQVDAVWDSTTGDTTQIIAILDTGVDWLHPDLAANIWANPNPRTTPDADGVVNDIRGWDYINNDNNPTDDNSHGTHVAGIAAAVGNNGIGIAGVNWHAKIMPIKVFQSSGRGDAATITKGIVYAATHGATVINMSFGSYARSITMENALENAYSTCVLVAAAGNDNKYIGPKLDCMYQQGVVFYPAGLSYVLGVQADGSCGMGFSNYDDSPIYSDYPELFNYELNAPGLNIISTIPNGNYRAYSGTSMASPLVAGAVSLYKTKHPLDSQELMWGNLINTSSHYIQIGSAINIKPKPVISFVSNTIVDTIGGDNKNGFVDAGETIQLWFMVRNTWGQSDSVFVGIRFGEFEDTTIAQIIKDTTFIGSISPYATRSNEKTPLLIHFNSNIANNRDIVFEGLLWYKGSPDTVKQKIVLTTNNGTYLSGIMDSTMVLTPNYLWVVNNSFKIGENGHLTIKPGTRLTNKNGIIVLGTITGLGTPDSLITIDGPGGFWGINALASKGEFAYTVFQNQYTTNNNNPGFALDTLSFYKCLFDNISIGGPSVMFYGLNITLKESIVRASNVGTLFYSTEGMEKCYVERNNFIDSRFLSGIPYQWGSSLNGFKSLKYNNFSNITVSSASFGRPVLFQCNSNLDTAKIGNNFIGFNRNALMLNAGSTYSLIKIPDQYWGTSDKNKITLMNWSFWDDPNLAQFNYDPLLTAPSDSAHGLVWKVLVDGTDPQDQANLMNPIGVGAHRIDVYFNRPMDSTYKPMLTFGVRLPFTQQSVADSGHWSNGNRIWTAYKNIQLYTGDGINTIRVASAKDPEGFEIPIEDMRFSFLISAASSSSNGFNSTAGLGKVSLDWEKPDGVPDLLGYNLYRFNNITDTTFNSPVLINTKLVTDTLYTDFNVIPNKKYYYFYKVVRTDFSESDSSKVIISIPFTAALGDANGDLSVTVLDVLTDVSYILGQNPQPFIFDAADVVRDSSINVLDVVGTVNIVLHGSLKKYLAKETYGNAKLELVGNTLKLNTDIPLVGIQFSLKGIGMDKIQYTGQGMTGFELASGNKGDTLKTIIYYNMNNTELQSGSYVLGTLQGVQSTVYLTEAVLADKNGNNVLTNVIDNGKSLIPTEYYLDQNFPNPFNMQTIIQYGVPQKTVGRMVIYNILGQKIKTFELGEINAGRYRIQWDGRNNNGSVVSSGVYIYRFESQKFTLAKKLLLLK